VCYYSKVVVRGSDVCLQVTRSLHKTIGARAFPIAAAKVWNSLPTAIKSLPTVHSFRRALKTELFVRSFGSARHRP